MTERRGTRKSRTDSETPKAADGEGRGEAYDRGEGGETGGGVETSVVELSARLAALGLKCLVRPARDGTPIIQCNLDGLTFVAIAYGPNGVVSDQNAPVGLAQFSAVFAIHEHETDVLIQLANQWNNARLIGRAAIDSDRDAVLSHTFICLDMSEPNFMLTLSMWRTAMHEFAAHLEAHSGERTLH